MQCEYQTKDELIAELERLKTINEELRMEKSQIWDMVKVLITKISHEFKTPLNSIIGFTELLKYQINDVKQRDYIDTISMSSQFMLSLIRDILDVTRSQYKPLELSYSIFNVKNVIEDIIKCFNNENIKYTLINMNICADYTRFKQLVYNLISNALKFNRAGMKISIITYCDKDFFYFDITDSGKGIPKENYEKIFEFFTDVSNDKFRRQMSSGIGLSLCKSIAESHKGKIFVTSELNTGSTFTFKIPINM